MRVIADLFERYKKDKIRRIEFCSLLLFLLVFSFLFWSEHYPIINRNAVEMHTKYWWLISSIVSVLAMYPINRRLYIYKQEERTWNISFIHWVLLGFPLALMFAVTPLIVNGWPDKSPSQRHVTTITGKCTKTVKGSTSYYLWLRDWRKPAEKFQFEVTPSFFEQKESGDTFQITTRQGFLNYEWATDYK